MKPFTKTELVGIGIIFALLVVISVPNFILSIRRARDQVRRDDMGAVMHYLDLYLKDFEGLPPSSPDGRIIDCLKPGGKVTVDKTGRLQADLRPCDWGIDPLVNLTPGSNQVYATVLPRDPLYQKGFSYLYFSDGQRYQIYAYMEGGADEAEYSQGVVARNLKCGVNICNVGRSYNVPVNISIEEYDQLLFNKK